MSYSDNFAKTVRDMTTTVRRLIQPAEPSRDFAALRLCIVADLALNLISANPPPEIKSTLVLIGNECAQIASDLTGLKPEGLN